MSTPAGGQPPPSGSTSNPPAPPGRTPTCSSYYDFNGVPWNGQDPNSKTWMYARDARQQQAGVPANAQPPYPSYFGNRTNLPLNPPPSHIGRRGQPGWLHHPLIPDQTATWTPGTSPGAVRSVYTAGNTANFDVIHHDPNAGTTSNGTSEFSMATYHPSVPRPQQQPPPTGGNGP
ncbi:hypothetical protein SAPIO_CDS7072 [Scedosporium apiospermum]|uniref:Uncharacterized protein n=1 Tax=Pseudallescheria apiosperma TaxID=563466 RepID=A0A084G123_PSEDA|nr:uncharacterized protein SAPIO_CDS7072 [Scedosporium apiospermum]KEZ41035.1 hypothetical protein SAPIO_CDS7072 [Scedosporium apiospermum]